MFNIKEIRTKADFDFDILPMEHRDPTDLEFGGIALHVMTSYKKDTPSVKELMLKHMILTEDRDIVQSVASTTADQWVQVMEGKEANFAITFVPADETSGELVISLIDHPNASTIAPARLVVNHGEVVAIGRRCRQERSQVEKFTTNTFLLISNDNKGNIMPPIREPVLSR
jgi:hypothetical protein